MEKLYFIDSSLLHELSSISEDTRNGALCEVVNILRNNITSSKSVEATDNTSLVNLQLLVRQLIRWFQFRPITCESKVLNLLLLVLGRRDFLRHVVKGISISRLRKEFGKIAKLFDSDELKTKVHNLNLILDEYESSVAIDDGNRTLPESTPPSIDHSIIEVSSETQEVRAEFWEVLDGLNLDYFNGIAAELTVYNEGDHLRNALNFLQNSVEDFPPEFFLQPPNILDKLIEIFDKVPRESSAKVIKIVRFVVNALRDRCLEAPQDNNDFPVKKQINNVLRQLTSFFQQLHQTFSVKKFKQNFEIYQLLLDVATFIAKTNQACEIFINELMNMIATVTKDLRLSYATEGSGMIRMHYMINLYIINTFAASIDTQNVRNYCENNVWEFESDIALLDGALKSSNCRIYELIMRNRKDVISDEKELMVLLDVSSFFKPLVKVMNSWESLSDEEILFNGLKALDSIRIHKSLELVDLLLTTVERCAEKFTDNKKLKETAEKIYLRLLSIEIPQIRRKTYKNICRSARERLDGEGSASRSLCSAVGFPLTTEIATEILCFGFADDDQEIHETVKSILFFILRAKVCFASHWMEVLNILKPILPMTPSLLTNEPQLKVFVFEVLQTSQVFDEFEVNLALARFLYCCFPEARNEAKQKLLTKLNFESSLIQIIPDDFCLIPSVKDLQLPNANLGCDIEAYETTCQVLKSVNRSDPELLHSVLLQLCVLMNSREVCQKSHDDNLWVFFLAALDMGFPDNVEIRQQTINILYRWVVCIQPFRIYLANEPTVLEFLVKTLVFFQDNKRIKTRTSCLLFLLLFSDFVVTSERSISLPQLLTQLYCPFNFDVHWTESPFNKISALEAINDEMESSEEPSELQGIYRRYLKFAFAFEKFPGSFNETGKQIIKVSKNLRMSPEDLTCAEQTDCLRILKKLCDEFENVTAKEEAFELIARTKLLLMFPLADEALFAVELSKKLNRLLVYSDTNLLQQQMLIELLQIYQRILPSLPDERVASLMDNKFIKYIIMENIPFSTETLIEGLSVINCVVELCGRRQSLSDLLVRDYERNCKVYLPTRIVEKVSAQIFDEIMKNGKWHEMAKRSLIKQLLTLLYRVLSSMPVQLDDAFLNKLFGQFLSVPMPLHRKHLEHIKTSQTLHVNSSLLKLVLGIVLRIASAANRIEVKTEQFKELLFWATEENRKCKGMLWLIVAQLTKTKESFDAFCKGFQESTKLTLPRTVIETLAGKNNLSSFDFKALAAVYGNILDHSTEVLAPNFVVDKLLCVDNVTALCFIIRKIVQNDLPGTFELITSKRLVKKFLCISSDHQRIADQFEAVATCYKFKSLTKHVVDTVTDNADVSFMHKLCCTKSAAGADFKAFNNNSFNILLILMSTEPGLMKITRGLSNPQVIDHLMFASHDGLRFSNPYNELMFVLGFWNSLLDANSNFNSPIIDRISKHSLDVTTANCVFMGECEEKLREKCGSVLEKEFHHVRFAVDLLFLQVVSLFEFSFSSKFSSEYKHDMKVLCSLIIKKLTTSNERVKQLAVEINLLAILDKKLNLTLLIMQQNRHLETSKKSGVQKCQLLIKSLAVLLKALIEWNLPLASHGKLTKDIFMKVLKVFDWIEADSVLMNCFLNLLQLVSVMDIGRLCVTSEIENKSLIKLILSKTQNLSAKLPHTENNLSLIRSGISTLQACSKLIEVRAMLKNAKVFQLLEVLHPQIYVNKRTTWDEVTVEWLKFFDFLSLFDDTECLPNQISLLCRFYRLGNAAIKKLSLVVIRNFAMKASIGGVLLNCNDFKQTVDTILCDSSDSQEKFLILQTLLSIASKSEQLKSKLKNSSLNRKLKDQLTIMQADARCLNNPENVSNMQLMDMLLHVLYPKE